MEMLDVLNWTTEPFVYLSRDEYNKKLYQLRTDPELELICTTHARRTGAFYNTWQHIVKEQAAELRVMRVTDDEFEITRYKYMNSQLSADEQNDGLTGGKCYDVLDDEFKQIYGISIERAYTARNHRDWYKALKECVPIQPHYAVRCEITENGYKADVSSAFGSQCLKPLPKLKGAQLVKGRQAPTPELPFAFYLNSHHFAIYGEFDTFSFGKSEFYNHYYSRVYNDFVLPEDDETILCPACELSLAPVMQRLYDNRSEHPEYKKVMNASIGMFHCRANPKLAHVAAVIIGRCVHMMNQYAKKIERSHNKIYLISTDSIMWAGKPSKLTVKEKSIGAFVSEEENIKFCVRSANCYQYERAGGEVITRYSGQIRGMRGEFKLGDIFTMSSEDIRLDAIYFIDGYFLTGEEYKAYERKELYHGERESNT